MPDKVNNTDTKIAVILNEIEHIRQDTSDIKDDMVTRSEFEPIQKLVFGVVALIVMTVFGALVALVVSSPL